VTPVADDPPPDLVPWGHDATVLERLGGGARNQVWAVRVGGRRRVARDSGPGRAGPALDWELDLLAELAADGFAVPRPVPTADGRRRVDCPELDLAWLPLDRLGPRQEAARTAAEAWEVANGWTVEPDHARRRLAELRRRLGGRWPS
jgi:Phosphotransferase enzyme family